MAMDPAKVATVVEREPGNDTMATVSFAGEDHTLGNALRLIIA
jgi:DNA-directed RNA polymerase subunit L